ncbi:hypothetical protein EBR21_00970 [bacterium]|nr:hypothetical protein [bacterium]
MSEKLVKQSGGSGDAARAFSLSMTAAQNSDLVAQLLTTLEVYSFVDETLVAGKSSLGSVVSSVSGGALSAPSTLTLPSFAVGKKFLPLSKSGDDFWLVESSSSGTNVIRPVNRLSSTSLATLPEHLKAVLPAGVSPIGFGTQFLILKSGTSVWIVSRIDRQLKATELAFPNASSPVVSAGQTKGSTSSVWLADNNSFWLLTASGADWAAKQSKINFTGVSGSLQRIGGVFSATNGEVGATGPVIAIFNSKVYLASLTLPSGAPVAGSSPTPVPTVMPTPMTFAQARSFCDGCHATNSGNAGALAKLSGTENLTTWINPANKAAIFSAVRDSVMPLGNSMTADDRARFLLFANDPKP